MDQFEFETENKKKKKLRKEPLYIILSILCLIIGGGVGFYFGISKNNQDKDNLSIYDLISENINTYFFDTLDSEYSFEERMLQGMVAGLGDRYSSYLTTDQADDLTNSINGSFEGIGVSFLTLPLGGLVQEVFTGSPANQAGVLAGDLITHVQGTSIAGYDSTRVKSMIIGEKDTEVSIQVLRDGKKKTFEMKRGSVESSVGYEIREKNKQKIGYLRITTFGDTTTALVGEALENFESQGIQNICIDLRGNGGGYITAVNGLLDYFIPEGQLMFKIQYKDNKNKEYLASDVKKYSFEQGYILVDGDTASASEVMATSLNELLNYKVVGEKTYGKGVVQTQIPLTNSSTLKLTTSRWLTPKGNWINEKGIEPDYQVKNISITDFGIFEALKTTYHYDQVSNEIANMQKILKLLGYPIDRTDGYFSQKTQDALKKFEKKYGLTVNGIYDKNDLLTLTSALSYHIHHKTPDYQYQKVVNLLK